MHNNNIEQYNVMNVTAVRWWHVLWLAATSNAACLLFSIILLLSTEQRNYDIVVRVCLCESVYDFNFLTNISCCCRCCCFFGCCWLSMFFFPSFFLLLLFFCSIHLVLVPGDVEINQTGNISL